MDIHQSTHNADCPVVTREEYDVMGVDAESYLSLMDDSYERRFDLQLASGVSGGYSREYG